MKSHKKDIDLFINEHLDKFLFEMDDVNSFEATKKYITNEKKRLKGTIDADNKLRAAQTDSQERAIKEKQIKMSRDRVAQLKDLEIEVNKQEKEFKDMETKQNALNMKKNTGQVSGIVNTNISMSEQQNLPIQKKKTYLVHFDSNTEHPFDVKFSERGFSVQDTRLSFELLENAVSKNFSITLNGGQGLVLDPIKIQKILKYKDRF